MAPGERPTNCLAIARHDSPSSFSWQIFALSSGVYLAFRGRALGFIIAFLLVVDLALFYLTKRYLLVREGEFRLSPTICLLGALRMGPR
jgi:hypothetical protein